MYLKLKSKLEIAERTPLGLHDSSIKTKEKQYCIYMGFFKKKN